MIARSVLMASIIQTHLVILQQLAELTVWQDSNAIITKNQLTPWHQQLRLQLQLLLEEQLRAQEMRSVPPEPPYPRCAHQVNTRLKKALCRPLHALTVPQTITAHTGVSPTLYLFTAHLLCPTMPTHARKATSATRVLSILPCVTM